MLNLDEDETAIIRKILASAALQNLIGAEEWDLSEAEEERLWIIIRREARS
jgi:hypothetical protein